MQLRENLIYEFESYFNGKGILISRKELISLVNKFIKEKNLNGQEKNIPIFGLFLSFIIFVLDYFTFKNKKKNITKSILDQFKKLKMELKYFEIEQKKIHTKNFLKAIDNFKNSI